MLEHTRMPELGYTHNDIITANLFLNQGYFSNNGHVVLCVGAGVVLLLMIMLMSVVQFALIRKHRQRGTGMCDYTCRCILCYMYKVSLINNSCSVVYSNSEDYSEVIS